MDTMRMLACVAVLLASAPLLARPDDESVVYEAPPDLNPTPAPLVVYGKDGRRMDEPRRMLSEEDVLRGGAAVYDFGPLPPERVAEVLAALEDGSEGSELRPPTVGLTRTLGEEAVSIAAGHADVYELEDGRLVWSFVVRSAGAAETRLHFAELDLKGGTMLLYAPGDGRETVRGPYTGRGPAGTGDFWAPTVPGDEVVVEVTGEVEPSLVVTEIAHLDEELFADRLRGGTNGGGVFNCQIDAMCEGSSAGLRHAVGRMLFFSGGQWANCTGTLLNDLDGFTSVPFFLTAFHCLSTQAEVDTMQVTWFFHNDVCNGTAPTTGLSMTTGGTLLATSSTSPGNDMTFIRLRGPMPGGLVFAGWSTATSTGSWGLHHPSGTVLRHTWFEDTGICPDCLCQDGSDYDYYDMTGGLVEGGSSGSAIFNSGGQVVGQLQGRCGSLSDPGSMDCSNLDSYWAVYGEFQTTHPIISGWLNLGGTIWVDANWGGGQNGTSGSPYRTVAAAHGAAWNGAELRVKSGTYFETPVLNKAVTIIAHNGVVRIGG